MPKWNVVLYKRNSMEVNAIVIYMFVAQYKLGHICSGNGIPELRPTECTWKIIKKKKITFDENFKNRNPNQNEWEINYKINLSSYANEPQIMVFIIIHINVSIIVVGWLGRMYTLIIRVMFSASSHCLINNGCQSEQPQMQTIPKFSFKKVRLRMLSKWQPFCSGLTVLIPCPGHWNCWRRQAIT